MFVLVLILGGIHVLMSLGLYMWARWVARRHAGAWWRGAAWLPLVALGLSLLGAVLTAVFLERGFGGLADADPAMKASLLASSISRSMNCGALLVLPAALLFLASLVSSTVGTVMRVKR